MSPLSTSRFLRHRDRWITPVVVMRFSFLSFMRNRDLHTAATLAFYGMFALIPLCLAVLFLLSQYFVSSQRASWAVENLIIQIVPQYYEVILREVFSLAEQKTIGFIGLIPLLWSVVPLVSTIRTGFINVFKTERNAGFFREKLIDFLTVLILLLLFIGLVGGQILYATALGDYLAQKSGLLGALNDVVPPLAGALFLALFFMVFSPVRLEWWNVLVSAIFTGAGYVLGGLLPLEPLFVTLTVGAMVGFGIGAAYTLPIGLAAKWFPDRKGLVTGLAMAGFGAGSSPSSSRRMNSPKPRNITRSISKKRDWTPATYDWITRHTCDSMTIFL